MNFPALVEVEVSNTQSHLTIDQGWIREVVQKTLSLEGILQASISIALVDDASIRVINRRHLSHD